MAIVDIPGSETDVIGITAIIGILIAMIWFRNIIVYLMGFLAIILVWGFYIMKTAKKDNRWMPDVSKLIYFFGGLLLLIIIILMIHSCTRHPENEPVAVYHLVPRLRN